MFLKDMDLISGLGRMRTCLRVVSEPQQGGTAVCVAASCAGRGPLQLVTMFPLIGAAEWKANTLQLVQSLFLLIASGLTFAVIEVIIFSCGLCLRLFSVISG